MSRLSKQIREFVKCPQFDGGYEYGDWGILRLDQRQKIKYLCEEIDMFENAADKFGKENMFLKQQLSEKDKEIKSLKTQFDLYRSMNIQKGFDNPDVMKALRHEICEKIRAYFEVNPDVVEWDYLNEILNQIEGEK